MTDTPEVNDIPAILARANAATEGAWRAYDERGVEAEVRSIENGQSFRMARLDGWENNMANAEFIAHSRTDVPNMAAEILSLRAQVEDTRRMDFAEEYLDHIGFSHLPGEEPHPVLRWFIGDGGGSFTTNGASLREAIDKAIEECSPELSRREKENG